MTLPEKRGSVNPAASLRAPESRCVSPTPQRVSLFRLRRASLFLMRTAIGVGVFACVVGCQREPTRISYKTSDLVNEDGTPKTTPKAAASAQRGTRRVLPTPATSKCQVCLLDNDCVNEDYDPRDCCEGEAADLVCKTPMPAPDGHSVDTFQCTRIRRCKAGERCCPGIANPCVLDAICPGSDAHGAKWPLATPDYPNAEWGTTIGFKCNPRTHEPCAGSQKCFAFRGGRGPATYTSECRY